MKTRNQIIATLITWSLAFVAGIHAAERSQSLKGSRPNIILIMTDDQGLGDMSLSGNTLVKTPHMDAFYANSTRLTDFHVSPSCAPTRSVIMTGKHEFMHGVTHTKYGRNRIPTGLGTIAHEMKRAQYQTAIFGKWHLGVEAGRRPEDNGFDESFVLPHGGHGMFNMNPVMIHNGEVVKCKGFSSEVIIGQTLSWIKSAKEQDDPFFIYLPTPAPHGPYKDNIPAEWKKKWLAQGYNQNVAGRYALVEDLDTQLGRFMKQLNAWKLMENTLVIFITDNGPNVGGYKKNGKAHKLYHAGFSKGKGGVFEGSTRVPSFWQWKGVFEAGRDISELTAHFDFFPTFMELAGIEPVASTPKYEGRSLLPLFSDPEHNWADRYLYFNTGKWEPDDDVRDYKFKSAAIRNTKYRLIWNRDQEILLNLEQDMTNQNNVAKSHPEIVKTMKAEYEKWWERVYPHAIKTLPPAVEQEWQKTFIKLRKHEVAPTYEVPAF